MALLSYKAKAPGSLILMGEYAVLYGFPAIVTAINKTILVSLTPRTDNKICIHSSLGYFETNIDSISIQAPFEYVLTTLKLFKNFPSGLTLHIENEFLSTLGLGSSAAVTVALLAVLYQWQEQEMNLMSLYHDALQVIHTVQGGGSGADIAASIFGGTLEFNANPFSINLLSHLPPMVTVYSGHKTTTTDALEILRKRTDVSQPIFSQLGALSLKAKTAILQNNWFELGNLMNQAQLLLVDLGVSTPSINQIITTLLQQKTILGTKISGSGLGDCVIGLGSLEENNFGEALLDIQINGPGVCYVN